jgi:glycosyltransferase involved in cell wall biosynthesis
MTDNDTSISTTKPAPRGTYALALPWDLNAIGGVTQVVVGLHDMIARDGRMTPCILVASWPDTEPVARVDSDGRHEVRMRVRNPLSGRFLVPGILRYLLALPAELRRVRTLVRRHSLEVVNCHYIGTSEFTWIIAKRVGLFRGKVILSLHGLDIRSLARLRGIRKALWRWVLSRADAVVACSDGLAEETRAAFHLSEGQVCTIHNGVDLDRVYSMVQSEPKADLRGAPALLNLGTLEHKKGHDLLLRAYSDVVKHYPRAHLTIMGRRAETADETVRLMRELGLEQCITICEDASHETALTALRDSDIFVLSSRNEAFSVALLEAGAFGKPIVATDVCGVAELIEDGITGLRVPPEDVEALTNGILRLLSHPEAAAELGRQVKQVVRTRFTLEANCESYLRLALSGPRITAGTPAG